MALFYLVAGVFFFFWSVNYYWPRVIYAAAALLVWAVFALFLPVWAVSKYLTEGQPLNAIVATVVCLVPALIWVVAANQAIRAVRATNVFWKSWNHR